MIIVNQEYKLRDVENMAELIVPYCYDYPIITVNGELGAGKTTLAAAIFKALGVSDPISSPTFSIVNVYSIDESNNAYHMDLYRMKDVKEIFDSGIDEMWYDNVPCIIEWPDVAIEIIPQPALQITIESIDEHRRWITAEIDDE